MTNRCWCFPVLLVTILFICFGAAVPGLAAKKEPLRVLTIHPSGEIDRVKQITITFNQPMVPLGEMDRAPGEAPVFLEPALEGRYRWLNVYTLAYELETPLEGSFSGRITVKKKTKALSGASLRKDVQATFILPLIKPTRISPKPKTAGLALRPQIRLSFNQALDLDRLQRSAYFRTMDGQRVPCLVRADEKADSRRRPGGDWTVIITPARDLPPDTAFDLVAPPGLASASGPLLSDSEFHWPYRTYGPLGVKEIVGYRPRAGAPFDPESGLQIRFTNPISPREVVRNLKVSPKYDLSQVEGGDDQEAEPVTSLWLPGPFHAASLYTFTFSAGIRDVFGQPLKGRTNFQVNMGPARPVLELPGRQGVLESATNPSYPFRVRNISRVNVRGHFLRPDKVIPFIIKHRLYRYLSESTQDMLADLPPYEVKTSQMEISVPPNTMNYQPVRLKKIFGSDVGQGLLYFDLNAPETNHPKDGRPVYRRALVQVTDVGLSVKFGRTNTLIWTTDLGTGRPLAKVRLEIRNLQNHVLWRGESNEQGLAMAPGA
ncbi:MAG: hypothetical protein SV487_06410, partial [Thermodesulfobacteriota bacterium]|nr:hypothetical protein [Thermodesulfobacteriota bacterium]